MTILLLGFQTNNLLIYYTLFKINQRNLIQTVCEQKVKDCNACCYLDKKMTEENNEESPAANQKIKSEQKVSEYVVISFHNNSYSQNRLLQYEEPDSNTLQGYTTEPTQPPQS